MGRRKKEPLQSHRERIAAAASALFVEKGAAAATMDEIAQASGYSKATLYAYFANKEEIFFLLVYQHMHRLYNSVERLVSPEISSRAQWTARYLDICFTIQALCREYPLYFEAMIGDINVDVESAQTPQVYREIYDLGLRLSALVRTFIEKGIPWGLFQKLGDSDEIMIFFWSSVTGIIRMAAHKQAYYRLLGFDRDAFLRREFLALLRGCRAMQEAAV